MANPIKKNHFSTTLLGLVVVLITLTYSCTNSATTEDKSDTTTPADTMMKMTPDSTIIDTSGKGGQPTPPRN